MGAEGATALTIWPPTSSWRGHRRLWNARKRFSGPGYAPDPAGGAYSAPPDILILVVFKGAYLRGGRGGEVKEGPQIFWPRTALEYRCKCLFLRLTSRKYNSR